MDPSFTQQVAEAENALTQRARELFQKTEDNIIEEKRALDNATYFPRTLLKTMECNSAGPVGETGHARAA